MTKRRRFRQVTSLQDRLNAFAHHARSQASQLSKCSERESLLKRAEQADRAIAIELWLKSPGLQPPK